MTKVGWKRKIIKSCKEVGTYRESFDPVIDTLADILERRDATLEVYEKTGGHPIVKHTNKAGADNYEQNPALRLVNDLNRDALAYWRDLGLTPAGLKKLNDKALDVKVTNKKSFSDVLESLGI
jgi:hypothetical protein